MFNLKAIEDENVYSIPVTWNNFPDGSSFPVIEWDKNRGTTFDTIIISQDEDNLSADLAQITQLGLLVQAIDTLFSYEEINLNLLYMPHARADRVFVQGMSNPLDFVCAMIYNITEWDNITVTDPHSEETLIRLSYHTGADIRVIEQKQVLNDILVKLEPDFLVSPDAGAKNKTKGIRNYLRRSDIHPRILHGHKKRNTDGSIQEIKYTTELQKEDIKDKTVVVVDDICDGGGTFIPYASMLREYKPKEIILLTTFGIYSNGIELLEEHFDKVICKYRIKNFKNLSWNSQGTPVIKN